MCADFNRNISLFDMFIDFSTQLKANQIDIYAIFFSDSNAVIQLIYFKVHSLA